MARINPGRLPYSVELFEDELTASFLSRTSWANGFASLDQFCNVTGWKPFAIAATASSVTGLISDWTAAEAGVLQRFSIRGGRVVDFGAGTVRRSQLERRHVRYCPVCLLPNGQLSSHAPMVSAVFQWRVISHCPVHACRIASVPTDLFRGLGSWDALANPSRRDEAPHLSEASAYFYHRIVHGRSSTGFIDELPAYVAAEFCSLIGHLHLRMEAGTMSDAIQGGYSGHFPRALGFTIASRGKQAIWDFLAQHVQVTGDRISIPSRIYSPFKRWFEKNSKNADYDGVFAFLEQHAQAHIPVGPNALFAQHPCKPQVHNITTASKHYGLSTKRVRKLLRPTASPLSQSRLFRAVDCHSSLKDEAALITLVKAAELLACSPKLVGLLTDAALLQVFGGGQGSPRRVQQDQVVALSESIISEIDPKARCEGLKPIEVVLDSFPRQRRQILQALAKRYLKRIACQPGTRNVGDVHLDDTEIKWIISRHSLNRVLIQQSATQR